MARRYRVASALVAVLVGVGGCNLGAAFERATAYQDGFESTGAEVTGDPSGETGGDAGDGSPAINTATGAGESSEDGGGETSGESTGLGSSETSAAPQAAPPEIESFTAPESVWQVGAVELKIAAAGEVEEVELQLEHVPVVTVAGGELAHVWEVLGEQQNGPHLWTAVARGPGGEVSRDLEIPVLVPPPGQVQWQLELPADGDLSVGFGVTTIPGGGAVVSGVRHEQGVSRAIVRRYDGGAVTSTWTPATWGSQFVGEPSIGVDVALAPDGAFVVAANIGVDMVRRRYVAKLTAAGGLLWERAGNVGEEAAGLTVDAEGRVYLAGSQLAPNDSIALAVWSWNADGGEPWTRSWGGGEGEKDEHGTAVTVVGDHVVVVGEQEPTGNAKIDAIRSVAVFFTPEGADFGATWISAGEFGGDAALDVVTIGDEYCLAGWAADPQRALVRCSVDLQPTDVYISKKPSIARSIAHNRAGEVVIAGEEANDLGERAFIAALEPWVTTEHWNTRPVDSGSRAFGVACDEWGACTWTGFVTTGNMAVCVAGGLTP